jgi:hypothetical protein
MKILRGIFTFTLNREIVYYTISEESACFFNEQYTRAPASEDSIASWKIALWSRIVYV